MRGWFKTLKYYKENPVEASEIIAKHYDITPEKYRKQVEGLFWEDYAAQIRSGEGRGWIKAFNIISELKFMNGRIPKKPDVERSINRNLLKELYE